jgi:hypothetical protein
MMKDLSGRIGRIDRQVEKIERRLKAKRSHGLLGVFSGDGDQSRLRARLAELMVSRDNIKKFGQETVPTGNPVGADLSAPNGGR